LVRIATYNLNGIKERFANLVGCLREAAPDIVCRPELKSLR
jgi:exonuclease III